MELSERNIKQLEDDGFKMVYEWFDEPNVTHQNHNHETDHEIIITEGSLSLMVKGGESIYTTGDRFTIPANIEHSVKAGPEGCKYVIGE